MINRRAFVATGVQLAVALPALAACRRSSSSAGERAWRGALIGFLGSVSDRSAAFRRGMRELGWKEGSAYSLEYSGGGPNDELLERAVRRVVEMPVDLLLSVGDAHTVAAKRLTSTTPIVMAISADPVGLGFVASLARPGGTITGLTTVSPQLAARRLELLREVQPSLARPAVLWYPAPGSEAVARQVEEAAGSLGLRLQSVPYNRDANQPLDDAFAAIRSDTDALMVLDGVPHLGDIADRAKKRRLPTLYVNHSGPENGGLMSYGADELALFKRAAAFVDRVLKGARPAELPVELPTVFRLVINRATVRALGLTLPPGILAQATDFVG